MNTPPFPRRAIIQLTSCRNPEIGVGNLFKFLQQHIPLEAMALQLFDSERYLLSTIN
jgi:hypothetical protein